MDAYFITMLIVGGGFLLLGLLIAIFTEPEKNIEFTKTKVLKMDPLLIAFISVFLPVLLIGLFIAIFGEVDKKSSPKKGN